MITVRQIQRFWEARSFDRLADHLMSVRPERGMRLRGPVAAAGLAVIRLDELSQSLVPLYGELVRTVLRGQGSDGGWGDPVTTAVCLRALMCGNGGGAAVDLGLGHLNRLQRDDGLWPDSPVRRLPSDPIASAFVMLQLADRPEFRSAVRFDAAVGWFEVNEPALDEHTSRLWGHAARRCSTPVVYPARVAASAA